MTKTKLSIILLLLTLVISGCSVSTKTAIENKSIKDVIIDNNIVNSEETINAFEKLNVTSTKYNHSDFKDGNGIVKIKDKNGDIYNINCTDYLATTITDNNDKVLVDLAEPITNNEDNDIYDENNTSNRDYKIGQLAKKSKIFNIMTDSDYNNDIENLDKVDDNEYISLYKTNYPDIYVFNRKYTLDLETFSNDVNADTYLDKIENEYKTIDASKSINRDITYSIGEAFIGSIDRTEDEKLNLLCRAAALGFEDTTNNMFSYIDKMIFDNSTSTYYFLYTNSDKNNIRTNHYIIVTKDYQIEKDGIDYTKDFNKLIDIVIEK